MLSVTFLMRLALSSLDAVPFAAAIFRYLSKIYGDEAGRGAGRGAKDNHRRQAKMGHRKQYLSLSSTHQTDTSKYMNTVFAYSILRRRVCPAVRAWAPVDNVEYTAKCEDTQHNTIAPKSSASRKEATTKCLSSSYISSRERRNLLPER